MPGLTREANRPPETSPAMPLQLPTVTVQQVQNCAFANWYPTFRSSTLKSVVIPLSEEFVEYLNADGIVLPADCRGQQQESSLSDSEDESFITELSDGTEATWKQDMLARLRVSDPDHKPEEEEDSSDEDEKDAIPVPTFPELHALIEAAIEDMGGAVFAKLDWSSPKDACWVATGSTLKCVNPADVFLLLKSSDFVSHDLAHAFDGCATDAPPIGSAEGSSGLLPQRPERFHLVLRKWYELLPSMEFRCFVREGKIIGITQRDVANYYSFLLEEADAIQTCIETFFNEKIRGRFPDADFVFDVYLNQRNRAVWLLDFNPFGATTDTLLFAWDELLTETDEDGTDFRFVESPSEIVGAAHPAYAMNRLPRDAVELANGNDIDTFAERFRRNLYDAM
ncbi:hypothetical protein HKX48_005346 [Thoreauomyces humboldtii]|nr:hypothetical protein HKX48_005346 [Thoreauomyces humboldtii]